MVDSTGQNLVDCTMYMLHKEIKEADVTFIGEVCTRSNLHLISVEVSCDLPCNVCLLLEKETQFKMEANLKVVINYDANVIGEPMLREHVDLKVLEQQFEMRTWIQ